MNEIDTEFIPLRKAVMLTGLHKNTLRKYADTNQIKTYRSKSDQRMFHKPSLEKFCGSSSFNSQSKVSSISKQNFIYTRVSSKKQLDDLSRQIKFLQLRKPEYSNFRILQDVASGINFQRKGLQTILDACLQNSVGEIIVAHKDRLARFGFELIEYIVKKAGGKITVIGNETHKSPEEELSDDLLSIIHVFSCRQMGKRKYRTTKLQSTEDSSENKFGKETNLPEMVEIK